MALLSQCLKDKDFDVRMVQRALTKGLILAEEVEKHSKKLTDDGENADFVRIDSLMEGVTGKSGLR